MLPDPRLGPLLEQIARHPPRDALEAEHKAAMQQLAREGLQGRLAPLTRRCFSPGHFTASSFVLSPSCDAVLLILHAKLGLWLQPGGHIEASDRDMLSAARRELAEETGLASLEPWPDGAQPGFLDLDVHRIPAHRGEPAHQHHDLRFLFRSQSLALLASDEVRGARWVPLRSFEHEHGVRSDASVMRAVGRIRVLLAAAGQART